VKFLFDFFPIILFFIAYQLADIFVATGVAMTASILQIGWSLARRHKVGKMQWVSLGTILIFGGATLILRDETFIKWKPTVLYWLFGLVLLVGRLVFRRNLMAALLPDLVLPEAVWARMTWAWVAFLVAMGAANLYIAATFPTDVWVNFKIWGGIGMFMLAAVGTVASVARYLPEKS
jgi:intracellular septation protein